MEGKPAIQNPKDFVASTSGMYIEIIQGVVVGLKSTHLLRSIGSRLNHVPSETLDVGVLKVRHGNNQVSIGRRSVAKQAIKAHSGCKIIWGQCSGGGGAAADLSKHIWR